MTSKQFPTEDLSFLAAGLHMDFNLIKFYPFGLEHLAG